MIMLKMHHLARLGDRTPCMHIIMHRANNLKFIHVGPFVYTIDGQVMNIEIS